LSGAGQRIDGSRDALTQRSPGRRTTQSRPPRTELHLSAAVRFVSTERQASTQSRAAHHERLPGLTMPARRTQRSTFKRSGDGPTQRDDPRHTSHSGQHPTEPTTCPAAALTLTERQPSTQIGEHFTQRRQSAARHAGHTERSTITHSAHHRTERQPDVIVEMPDDKSTTRNERRCSVEKRFSALNLTSNFDHRRTEI
jgi:hypothetical protein